MLDAFGSGPNRASWPGRSQIVEHNTSVVLFETSLRGRTAYGLNVVDFQPDGLVAELTVFFRPLTAMQLVAEVIGGHMAQRFGPPPPGLQ